MSFAKWKKRSLLYFHTEGFSRINREELEKVSQAAYKAGERQGRKDAEEMAKRAIVLRELCRATSNNP